MVLCQGSRHGFGSGCGHFAEITKGYRITECGLCLTARRMKAEEAEKVGLVSTVFPGKEEMMEAALQMAADIASKSPVAVQGTKVNLVYSREHTVEEGLERVASYNMVMLQSEDVMKSALAAMDKDSDEKPEFAKL